MGDSRFPIYTEIGATGLNQYAGYVQEEILRELQCDRWKRAIREMISGDAIINAFLFATEMIAREVKWRVDPAGGDHEAQAEAEFVWGALNDMSQPWADVVSGVLSYPAWGFYMPELVYKRRQGDVPGPASAASTRTGGSARAPGFMLVAIGGADSWACQVPSRLRPEPSRRALWRLRRRRGPRRPR